MISNTREDRQDSGESIPVPVIEQPRRQLLSPSVQDETSIGIQEDQDSSKLQGLSPLAVTDSILIVVDSNCCRCDWDVHYEIKDSKEGEALMFTAVEELHCCYYGSIQNVVIRDLQKLAVARVCYKEKSCLTRKMILAVYAPPDLLVGTVDEDTGFCFSSKTDFKILNSDGQPVFFVEYQAPCFAICGHPYFSVKSADRKTEVAKILEKTKQGLRLQFNVKMGITSKILLSGFCLGLIHKPYNQESDEKKERD